MSNKSVLYFADSLYTILNRTSLTGVISGHIYKYSAPLNDKRENVVIIVNGAKGEHLTDIQNGIANINIQIPTQSDGTPNLPRFTTIVGIVRQILDDYAREVIGFDYYVSLENLYRDTEQLYFYNIQLTFNRL